MEQIYREHLDLTRIVPPPRLTSLTSFPTTKGLVSMEAFESEVIAAFKPFGLDLADKRIEEAKVPLRIVASDLTTQRPTAFTGRVRVLDALRCSACIPFVFEPQVLYGHVYVDGGVSVDCLSSIVPSDCLVLHISDTGTPLYPLRFRLLDSQTTSIASIGTPEGVPEDPMFCGFGIALWVSSRISRRRTRPD
jgi:hypothetical protein